MRKRRSHLVDYWSFFLFDSLMRFIGDPRKTILWGNSKIIFKLDLGWVSNNQVTNFENFVNHMIYFIKCFGDLYLEMLVIIWHVALIFFFGLLTLIFFFGLHWKGIYKLKNPSPLSLLGILSRRTKLLILQQR